MCFVGTQCTSATVGYCGATVGYCGATVGYCGATVGYCWATMGYCWATMGYCWATMGYCGATEVRWGRTWVMAGFVRCRPMWWLHRPCLSSITDCVSDPNLFILLHSCLYIVLHLSIFPLPLFCFHRIFNVLILRKAQYEGKQCRSRLVMVDRCSL